MNPGKVDRGFRISLGLCFTVLALVAGCAAPIAKEARTTVVLLPDEDGNVGAVSVSSEAGSQRIDRAYEVTTVDSLRALPSGTNAMGREHVDAKYAGILGAQPPKPKSFILHFLLNRTALTDESRAQLPAVLQAVRERKPTEITIFGHADSTGTEQYNVKLSAERARMIANLLRKDDPTLDHIDVQYFGDKVPLVPSDGRASEPRNRRAEIQIL